MCMREMLLSAPKLSSVLREIGISEDFCKNIWNLLKFFLSLQRQKFSFGYPGRIPRGQDHIATAHFKVTFGWLYLLYANMNFLTNDLSKAAFRFMRILFEPLNISTSNALVLTPKYNEMSFASKRAL